MSTLAARRRTVRALWAVLAVFVVALVGAPAAQAAPSLAPASVGTVTCGSPASVRFPVGSYGIRFEYVHEGARSCIYSSQYDWMVAIRDAVDRGVNQKSGYTYIVAQDGSQLADRGPAVKASFCATGVRCGVATTTANPGPATPQWSLTYYATCSVFDGTAYHGSETYVLRQFMERVGKVHFGNTASVTMTSPTGNKVEYHTSCYI